MPFAVLSFFVVDLNMFSSAGIQTHTSSQILIKSHKIAMYISLLRKKIISLHRKTEIRRMERINIEYEMQRHFGLTVMIEHKQKFPKSV